jgi:hypothetical protein
MSEMLGLPPPFLLLLPISLAAGVDLFLTLLVVFGSMELGGASLDDTGIGSFRLGVMLLLGVFYLTEGWMELRPLRSLLWHNLQLILRPLGAFLLALTLLEGTPTTPLLLGSASAAVVAAFSHVLSWGGKLQRFLSPEPSLSPSRLSLGQISPLTHTLAEDTLVLLLLLLAFEQPDLAFLLSGGVLLLALGAGGHLHHLTRFGAALLRARFWGAVAPVRWLDQEELPGWIQRWNGDQGHGGLRGLRAGIRGLPDLRGFREGWFLEAGPSRFFAWRRPWGAVFLSLDGCHLFSQPPAPLAQILSLEAPDGSKSALFLQRGVTGPKSHK